jgi:hypothetical protein
MVAHFVEYSKSVAADKAKEKGGKEHHANILVHFASSQHGLCLYL